LLHGGGQIGCLAFRGDVFWHHCRAKSSFAMLLPAALAYNAFKASQLYHSSHLLSCEYLREI
jgi:hypothetical protein